MFQICCPGILKGWGRKSFIQHSLTLDMPFKYKCELNQNSFLHCISYRDNIGITGGEIWPVSHRRSDYKIIMVPSDFQIY